MLTCQGGKGGKRPCNCSIISVEKLPDSKMATISSIHQHQERFTTLHISNLHLSWNLGPFLCNSVWGSRCYIGKQGVKKTHLIALRLFLFRAMSTFLCTLYTCVLHHCPSVTVQLWSEERIAWMKYPHLSNHADCRPGRVNFSWISIPMIGRSQLTSTNTDTDASMLYLNPLN